MTCSAASGARPHRLVTFQPSRACPFACLGRSRRAKGQIDPRSWKRRIGGNVSHRLSDDDRRRPRGRHAFPTGALLAQEVKLPSTLTFTAYDTGSSGFNIAVAVGKTLKDKNGTDVRVLPAGNDVARLAPLRADRAQASAMGIGTYFAQESVFEFAVKEWGPQQMRLILSATDCNAISLGVAKDTGVSRSRTCAASAIAMVVGSPALNQNAFAVWPSGDLTRSDVKLVEFSSYGAAWKGMVNNEVDAAIASNISGQVKEVETSPRGIVFPPTPAADKEGWARLQQDRPLLPAAQVDLRRRHPGRRLGRAAVLPLSDLHGLCLPAGRSRLQSRQGDDRQLRRLQGRRARRRRPRRQAPEPGMGAALPRGRRQGAEGSRRLEAGARGRTTRSS